MTGSAYRRGALRQVGASLGLVIALAASSSASAQDAPTTAQDGNRVPAATSPTSGQAAEPSTGPADTDVVVTGSRVITNGNNSPTPVTVATADALLEAQPASVIAGINSLPGLLGSINNTSNVNSGGFNTLNLRGIGSTRGLVLLDGLRIGPTQPTASVDVDVIPQILLKRVDVVTGGASAVYGSDAVSGVVNFITDAKLQGLKLNASMGVSTYADDRKLNLGAAYGTAFAGGKGHITVGYEYFDTPGFFREDRPFFNVAKVITGSVPGSTASPGSAANPYTLTYSPTLATATYGGLITSGPLAGLQFTPQGTLTAFNAGTPTGTTGVNMGGDGAVYLRNTAAPTQRIHRALARAEFALSDTVNIHAEGAYANFHQEIFLQNVFLNGVSIGYNNPFLNSVQSNYKTIIAAQSATGSFRLGKMDLAFPNYHTVADETYYLANGGLDGKLGKFGWNVDYYHTDSKESQSNVSNVSTPRLYAALNAVTNPANGQTVCNAALVNPSAYGSCLPLNVFGSGVENQAAINYIEQPTNATYRYKTDVVSGAISGPVFDLPAGPLNVALSGEWRKQSYSVASNATPFDPVSCTGIQFNCTSTTSPYNTNQVAVRTPVSQTVYEGAFEAGVPLLHGISFIDALDLNVAARYTHYSTSGGVVTWKVGGVWRVSDQLTLRATRSRDIRAPTLFDLYQAPTYTLRNYTDLLTNTTSTVNSVSQGNPNLTPEKANTFTAGIVLKPAFLPNFSLAVDYYQIDVNNAITTIDAFQPATQQTCIASGGTANVCSLYVRPFPFSNTTAANYPTLLLAQSLNLATATTYGVDVELNWRLDVAHRPLALRALVNYQPHLRFNNGPAGTVDVGGAADGVGGLPPIPKVKAIGSLTYDITDQFRVLVQERWRSKLAQNGNPNLIFAIPPVRSVGYTDLNLTMKVNDRFSAFFNMQNLFDTDPPVFASSGGSAQPNYLGGYAQGDEIEGRYFTVGVRIRM